MMRAAPFDGHDVSKVDSLFLQRLQDVLSVLKDIDLTVEGTDRDQITEAMRALRDSSLEERKSVYRAYRVDDQFKWYSGNAEKNRSLANRWTLVMLLVEAAGFVAAILKAVGTIRGDLLGFAGALVAAMTGWLQAKQHRTLSSAYSVAALELASVRSRIADQQSEREWAAFVAGAEAAISREHTLWKASRGLKVS